MDNEIYVTHICKNLTCERAFIDIDEYNAQSYCLDGTTAMRKYDSKILVVDPAAQGKDETAVAVMGVSSGYLVLFHSEGLVGGSSDENLKKIIEVAKRFRVDYISVEDNLSQGMFATLLRNKVYQEYGRFGRKEDITPVTTHHQHLNKQKRIGASLDPLINSGRLIITPDCLKLDYESANDHPGDECIAYRLTYQLSYFSASNGKELERDDRIDNLAAGVVLLKDYLTELPEESARDWDDYLIRKVFAQEDKLFYVDPQISTHKPFKPSRSHFV
jgi:hypothetical protein